MGQYCLYRACSWELLQSNPCLLSAVSSVEHGRNYVAQVNVGVSIVERKLPYVIDNTEQVFEHFSFASDPEIAFRHQLGQDVRVALLGKLYQVLVFYFEGVLPRD